jgi:hypothetical protein
VHACSATRLTDLWHFSDWLAAHAPEVVAPARLSRAVLEDYLLWVRRESGCKPATRNHRVVALRALLEEQAEDGLAGLHTLVPGCRSVSEMDALDDFPDPIVQRSPPTSFDT